YKALNYVEFVKAVTNNLIIEGVITYNPQSDKLQEITGRFYDIAANGEKVVVPFRIKTVLLPEVLKQLLESGRFQQGEPNTLLLGIIYSLLPFILLAVIIWFVLIRQIKMAGKGALSFGKSKARMLNKEKNRTTFKDVAGVEEAKEEVSELVEFLKDPK